jgi:hypothetical protein
LKFATFRTAVFVRGVERPHQQLAQSAKGRKAPRFSEARIVAFSRSTLEYAPLSIEYPIELREGCPKRPMLLRSICYAIAQHYRCACDINALMLKLNTFDDAKF